MGDISVRGETITDPAGKSREFNNFFVDIGSNISNSVLDSDIPHSSFLTSENRDSIFLEPIFPGDIMEIISHLNDTAGGEDLIPARVLKISSCVISAPLSLLINLCISKCYFPNKLKIGKVVPIFKTGIKNDLSNYRPISLLNVISKVFERLIHKKLTSFLDSTNIITGDQFGFRKNLSTNDAITNVLNYIVNSINVKKYCITVFRISMTSCIKLKISI